MLMAGWIHVDMKVRMRAALGCGPLEIERPR